MLWGQKQDPLFSTPIWNQPRARQRRQEGRGSSTVFLLLKLRETVTRSPCGHVCLFPFRLRRLAYKVIMSHWHGPAVQWDLSIRIMAQKGRAGNVLPAGSYWCPQAKKRSWASSKSARRVIWAGRSARSQEGYPFAHSSSEKGRKRALFDQDCVFDIRKKCMTTIICLLGEISQCLWPWLKARS